MNIFYKLYYWFLCMKNKEKFTEKEKKLLVLLWEKIKTKRKELKLSQSDLSEKTWIDRSYISMIERAEVNITYLKLMRIGEVLGEVF